MAQTPTKYELAINIKKALGIEMLAQVARRADSNKRTDVACCVGFWTPVISNPIAHSMGRRPKSRRHLGKLRVRSNVCRRVDERLASRDLLARFSVRHHVKHS